MGAVGQREKVMDEAKVLELARAAGLAVADDGSVSDGVETAQDLRPELAAFARLVAAAERERAAALCESLPVDDARCRDLMLTEQAWEEAQQQCADAIRSRTE